MMLPSIFGENLFDEWMNDSGLMNPNFFGKGHSPLYGKHASNIMKTDIRDPGTAGRWVYDHHRRQVPGQG